MLDLTLPKDAKVCSKLEGASLCKNSEVMKAFSLGSLSAIAASNWSDKLPIL